MVSFLYHHQHHLSLYPSFFRLHLLIIFISKYATQSSFRNLSSIWIMYMMHKETLLMNYIFTFIYKIIPCECIELLLLCPIILYLIIIYTLLILFIYFTTWLRRKMYPIHRWNKWCLMYRSNFAIFNVKSSNNQHRRIIHGLNGLYNKKKLISYINQINTLLIKLIRGKFIRLKICFFILTALECLPYIVSRLFQYVF